MLTKTVTEDYVITVAIDSAPECLAKDLLAIPSTAYFVKEQVGHGYISMTYRQVAL
jgi:hypothetical protein